MALCLFFLCFVLCVTQSQQPNERRDIKREVHGRFKNGKWVTLGESIECKTTWFPDNNGGRNAVTCAEIWCDPDTHDPVCDCIDFEVFGFRIAKGMAYCYCKPLGGGRRRLMAPNDTHQLPSPNVEACMDNSICNHMLIDYDIGFGAYNDTVSSRSSLCDETSGCTEEVFALFNNAAQVKDGECDSCNTECRECSLLNLYQYVEDDVDRTYKEAQQYCQSKFGSDLATIHSKEELIIALALIKNGGSPWIGLLSDSTNRERERPYFFMYIDCTDCASDCNGLYSGACVCGDLWEIGEPRACTEGSRFVRIRTDTGKIDNDKYRDETLSALLCNCAGSTTCNNINPKAKHSPLLSMIDDLNDADNELNPWYDKVDMHLIFGGCILFILINNVFICYWCLCKENKQWKHQVIGKIEK